jgi:hypothetical protein
MNKRGLRGKKGLGRRRKKGSVVEQRIAKLTEGPKRQERGIHAAERATEADPGLNPRSNRFAHSASERFRPKPSLQTDEGQGAV